MTYSLEAVYEIWNDATGSRIEIGHDRDGLGLIEIRQRDSDGKVTSSITMTKEESFLVYEAIGKMS